jgi:hypothetical protein
MTRERRNDRLGKTAAIAAGLVVTLNIVLLFVSDMKIAGIVVGRMGWTPFVALLLLIGTVAVPERRWGRALWLPWALMSLASAAYAFHAVNRSACTGFVRVVAIPALIVLSALSAIVAIYLAIGQKTRSVDTDQPSQVPGTHTDIPT